MAIFGKKCTKCGHSNSAQAAYCAECGAPMGGGEITCGVCHTQNRSDARFCKECGRSLAESVTPELRGHRWTRGRDDFAVRVEAEDLPGTLRRGIVVEMGTNALLMEGGANRGMLPPGTHNLDSLDKRILDWIKTGISSQVTVLLMDITPTEMEFQLDNVYTRDPIGVGLTVRLQAQVEEPGRFLVNMLGSRERFTREDLRLYLEPEVSEVVQRWISSHSVQELAEDLSLKEKLELALEEALKTTFAQSGLRFLQVRTMNINMEHLDHIKGVKSKYALQVTEAQAEMEGKQRLLDVMHQVNLQKFAEDSAKVEDEEKRAALYERMRQAVLGGKMDEVRSDEQFEIFMDDIDRQKLLREKDRTELLKTWKEEGDDKDSARAHMLAKLGLERDFELRSAELRMRTDLSEKELEGELRMERMRASKQFEIEAAKTDYELKQRRALAEFDRQQTEEQLRLDEMQHKSRLSQGASEHDEEMRQLDKELELGLKGLRGIKQTRLEAERGQLGLEKERKEFEWGIQQKQLEMEMQRERIQMEHELNRLDKLGQLGSEALIAASPAEQGKIIADLKKAETFKDMTEDQILALAAKDSPEVARALAEKFKAIAEGRSSEREREMYEKLLAEKEGRERASVEAWDKASARAKETAERAIDRMAETAQAFAHGQTNTPVIITGQGSGRGMVTNAGAGNEPGGETKTCPKCGRSVLADARHCEHCGEKFAGMN